ncbi:response regulator [bacterium]|nr:response regulator [bacterium]
MIRVYSFIKTIILLLLPFSLGHADIYPDLKFEQISDEHGLSQNEVNWILQDSDGFLWFGTEDGLNRYDGYNFIIYRTEPNNPNSLSSNRIATLYEDRSGALWIGTLDGGLNKFDRDTEQFTRYLHRPEDSTSISNNSILSIFEDKTGNLWIGTWGGGLNKFNFETNGFEHFQNDPEDSTSLSHNSIRSLLEDRSGELWVGTLGGGLNRFDRDTNQFIRYLNDPDDSTSISHNSVWTIYEDKAGVIWIGTLGGGLNQLHRDTGEFESYKFNQLDPRSLSHNSIVSIYEDRSGILWVGTWGGGLNKFNREASQFVHYLNDPKNPRSLSNNTIMSIIEEDSGILWMGTDGGGINKLDQGKTHFIHYKDRLDIVTFKNNSNIWSLHEDRSGALWIAHEGLSKLNLETGQITAFLHKPNDPNSLSTDKIFSLFVDSEGFLWIGTINGGVDKFDPEKEQFTHHMHDPDDSNSVSQNFITTIYQDRSGTLWFGTWSEGLNKLDSHGKGFTRYRHDPEDLNSLSDNSIWAIFEDQQGSLWIGTEKAGLNKLDPVSGKITRYMSDPEDATSLSHNHVTNIHEDQVGTLWIGTWGGGLNRFDQGEENFIRYSQDDGLLNDVICGILEDAHGNLWLSGNRGIAKYNPRTNIFRNYTVTEGLQHSEFNQGACYKGNDGTMYFGGPNGLNVFHPDSIIANPHVPPVILTDFKLFHESVEIGPDGGTGEGHFYLPKHVSKLEELKLRYDQNDIAFKFVALDYHLPLKNQYAYILEGLNADWISAGAESRIATYTNLDPGKYIFRVKGSNNDGIWNEEGSSLTIIITPPWWGSNLAYVIYIFLIASTLFAIWRFQMSRVQLKHQVELEHLEAERYQEIDQLRSRFFANISHEFRTPLTLILGPIEKLLDRFKDQESTHDLRLMGKHARRLLELVTELLDLSRLEAQSVRLRTSKGNIIPLLKGIVHSFSSMAEGKQIKLSFNSEYEDIQLYYEKDVIVKIISNLMSNALKFTDSGGTVQVEVLKSQDTTSDTEGTVDIIISDTGVGIPGNQVEKIFDRFYQVNSSETQSPEGAGIGLALIRELVELHKAKISVESEEGTGTSFTLHIPLGKAHLNPDEIVQNEMETEIPDEPSFQIDDESELEPDPVNKNDSTLSSILIVEDNPDVRTFIRSYLDQDYQCLEAENGQDGLNVALEKIPDLIISDIMMPGMNGNELCKRVKTDARTSHIPVILLTARADLQSKLEGLETGADDYLTKPFEARELQQRIRNLLLLREKLRKRFSRGIKINPVEMTVSSMDEQFLKRAIQIVEENMENEDFGVEQLARQIGMSHQHLNRKLRALTDHSAQDFSRNIRLRRAALLLEKKNATILEITYKVGFSDPSNFARAFRKQFGLSPSEYTSQHSNTEKST